MDDIKKAIVENYNLGSISSISKIEAGFLSENYSISTPSGKFFLKRYIKDVERVQDIHKVKMYFASHGVPVILPMTTVSGKSIFSLEDNVFALFPFVTGIHHNRQHIQDSISTEIAKLLADMHQIAQKSPMTIPATFKFWNKDKLRLADEILTKIDFITNKSEFDKLAQKNIELKKKLINQTEISHTAYNLEPLILIHGDFHEQNLFFDEKGRIKYIFDFGETKMGLRGYELWRSADYMFLNGKFTDENIRKVIHYLRAYNSFNSISEEILSACFRVYFQMHIHSFWVESEHYLKTNNRVDGFLEERSTSYFAQHRDEFLTEILKGVYRK
jgi:Ser/Thr protein kinase RdoA (MazF antagonist)